MRFFEMNNIFVYIEMEGGKVADVSLELLTKGRELATTLGVKLEAVVLGTTSPASKQNWPNTAPIRSGLPMIRYFPRSARCPTRRSCAV